MIRLSFKATQIYATLLVTIFIGATLIWDKFHGGVPYHHLLQRKDLPGISNWWGLMILPLLCWISFYKIQIRIEQLEKIGNKQTSLIRNCLTGFFSALVFGIVLAVAFVNGQTNFINYQVDCLLLLFFLVPLFRSEYILGFILGMTITFGAVLPTAFALIIAIPGVIIYVYIRPFFIKLIQLIFKKRGPQLLK